jgi:hypothetical protein
MNRSKMDLKLIRFGIDLSQSGAHFARTMMFEEIQKLFSYVENVNASKDMYKHAIEEDNCLGKRSHSTRKITLSKLSILYGLDPELTVFRTMRYLWNRDEQGRPLIALMCSLMRDRILRNSIPFILQLQEGEILKKEQFEEFLNDIESERFTKSTLESTIRNLSSTWTQSGHLNGRIKKVRSTVRPTPGAVSYGLFLGYLMGVRGKALFETDIIKLLGCSYELAIELAEQASRSGWIITKRVGDVIEVLFPKFLTKQEVEWLNEQD